MRKAIKWKYNSEVQKFRRKVESENKRKVFCFGGSSGEALDYIFGSESNYYSFWYSGMRGSDINPVINKIREAISEELKGSIAIVVIGTADAIHAQYVAQKYGVYDLKEIITRSSDGYREMEKFLLNSGCSDVITMCYSPFVDLPMDYWKPFCIENPLPNNMLGKFMADLAISCEGKLTNSVNLIPLIGDNDNFFLCREEFKREHLDHHVSYVKVRSLVCERLMSLDGLPKMAKPILLEHYPHCVRSLDNIFSNESPSIRSLNGKGKSDFPYAFNGELS